MREKLWKLEDEFKGKADKSEITKLITDIQNGTLDEMASGKLGDSDYDVNNIAEES